MSSSQHHNTLANPAADPNARTGFVRDPGPYEGIVVSHVLGTRSGQLRVWIPQWGAVKTDPENQCTVSYCSPFFGQTYNTDIQAVGANTADAQYTAGQSYGMWFVPPDVGTKVLCIFANGDKGRGYWIGCVVDSISHHMVPGIARNVGGNFSSGNTLPPTPDDELTDSLGTDSVAPVVEGFSGNPESFIPTAVHDNPRYLHEPQMAVYRNQGLDRDPIRGAISSSSLREAPSNVYGISTPGRSITGRDRQVDASISDDPTLAVIARFGGHQFIMDDGSQGAKNEPDGTDQLIRLRTSGGHQILMNDTHKILYIASSTGNQWLEFSKNGSINVYGATGLNMRTEGVLNLQGDAGVLIQSQNGIKINGDKTVVIHSDNGVSMAGINGISIKTDGSLNVSAQGTGVIAAADLIVGANDGLVMDAGFIRMNNGQTLIPGFVAPTTTFTFDDTTWSGTNWVVNPEGVTGICTTVPCHEPWDRSQEGSVNESSEANTDTELGIRLAGATSFSPGQQVGGTSGARRGSSGGVSSFLVNQARNQIIKTGVKNVFGDQIAAAKKTVGEAVDAAKEAVRKIFGPDGVPTGPAEEAAAEVAAREAAESVLNDVAYESIDEAVVENAVETAAELLESGLSESEVIAQLSELGFENVPFADVIDAAQVFNEAAAVVADPATLFAGDLVTFDAAGAIGVDVAGFEAAVAAETLAIETVAAELAAEGLAAELIAAELAAEGFAAGAAFAEATVAAEAFALAEAAAAATTAAEAFAIAESIALIGEAAAVTEAFAVATAAAEAFAVAEAAAAAVAVAEAAAAAVAVAEAAAAVEVIATVAAVAEGAGFFATAAAIVSSY